MPLRKIGSGRPNVAPFVHIRSSLGKARELPDEKIMAALDTGGIRFKSQKTALRAARSLRGRMTRALDELGPAGPSPKHSFVSAQVPDGKIDFKISLFPSGRVLIRQWPALHGVTLKELGSFQELRRILHEGFRGFDREKGNVFRARARRLPGFADAHMGKDIAHGDMYSLEMMAPMQRTKADPRDRSTRFVRNADVGQIANLTVRINPRASDAEFEDKKRFYTETLGKLGVPIRYKRGYS